MLAKKSITCPSLTVIIAFFTDGLLPLNWPLLVKRDLVLPA
jgi:hypothetical protein